MGRAKRTDSGAGSEYAGTGPDDNGVGGTVVSGTSEPLDPDAASGSGGSGGDGSGSGGRDAFGTEFDARIHSGERTGDGAWAKRRGRKRGGSGGGSGPRPKASKADLKGSIESLTKVLVILHTGIAGISNTPELVIDEEEGRMLAAASANVMEQFDLRPDPKTEAIVGLAIAGAAVYGPRVALIQMRKAQEKAERKAGPNGVGTAGVYGPNGEPMGTTEFEVQPEPLVWPPPGHTN